MMETEEKRLREELGNNVMRFRKKLQKVTQEKLGQMTGLDRSYIGAVERGEINISLVNICKIALALDVRPDQLLDFEEETLIAIDKIDDVFCKVLTPNDDSGRHGVLIPVFAYRLFPSFIDFDPSSETNYETDIVTYWNESAGWSEKRSKWKHYHRYPERRMTSLSPELLNNKQEGSLIIVGKFRDSFEYECLVVTPDDPIYAQLGEVFKLSYVDEKDTRRRNRFKKLCFTFT